MQDRVGFVGEGSDYTESVEKVLMLCVGRDDEVGLAVEVTRLERDVDVTARQVLSVSIPQQGEVGVEHTPQSDCCCPFAGYRHNAERQRVNVRDHPVVGADSLSLETIPLLRQLDNVLHRLRV